MYYFESKQWICELQEALSLFRSQFIPCDWHVYWLKTYRKHYGINDFMMILGGIEVN